MDHLIEIIFTNLMPSITSFYHQCDYYINRNFATYVPIDKLLTEGLSKIQEAINDTVFEKVLVLNVPPF